MRIYTVEVNGTAVMAFPHEGPALEAGVWFDSKESGLRDELTMHAGSDGRPLLKKGDRLNLRAATAEECACWQPSVDSAEADWKQEGWFDFDRAEYLIFLVPVTDMLGDVDADEEEAA